jgi:hypothetical protein
MNANLKTISAWAILHKSNLKQFEMEQDTHKGAARSLYDAKPALEINASILKKEQDTH